MGRAVRMTAMALSTLLIAGCRHKQQPPVLALPPQATVPLVPAPEPSTPPQVATVPVTPPPLPNKTVQPKLKKPKKKIEVPAEPVATPPVQVAAVAPPPDLNVVGSLTAGGNEAPAARQKAEEAIGRVEKRLSTITDAEKKEGREGLTRVRTFLRQAHQALDSGDSDGAQTLAVKAMVLLDDLLK